MTQEEMEEKEAERETKKNERKRDTANTAQAIRIAANVASASPDPYVGGVAKAIVVADKATGGLSTKIGASALNRANRITPFGKLAQKQINKSVESGAAAIAGMIASKGMDAKNAADTAKNAADAKKTAAAAKQASNVKKEAENAKKAAAAKKAAGATKQAASSTTESEDKKSTGGLILVIASLAGAIPVMSVLIIPMIIVFVFLQIGNYNANSISNYRTITINSSTNSIYNGTYDLDEYIAGVLAAENSPANNLEYYKYRAISVRTEFLRKAESNVVEIGNGYMDYISVEESPHQDTIEEAVEATAGKILMSDNPFELMEITSKVTKKDNNNYYIEYKQPSSATVSETIISKAWEYISHYTDNLEKSYSSVSTSEDYNINNIMALYLISSQNYTYEEVTQEYYENVNIVDANIGATGALVGGFITPLENFSCSNGFGCRLHPIDKAYRLHTGVDLGAKSGTLIYAAKAGEVTELVTNVPGYSTSQGYGNYVTIEHYDGSQTRYAHMLYNSIPSTIYIGATVTQGQIIGKVGSTGKSTGPHLHYEIFVNGDRVNPYYYMDLSKASNDSAKCNSNANVPMSNCGF